MPRRKRIFLSVRDAHELGAELKALLGILAYQDRRARDLQACYDATLAEKFAVQQEVDRLEAKVERRERRLKRRAARRAARAALELELERELEEERRRQAERPIVKKKAPAKPLKGILKKTPARPFIPMAHFRRL
ncbi:hypothetical protein M3Y99_01932500 [Aphelenchoides fujianensis]|nr:hypothetical protein M3Y99_01932500 [Aphelenchoides fujianensis]